MRRFLALLFALLPAVASAQTTGTVMPVPKIQFFTNTGAVCNGCKLYHYTAGTTSSLDVYTDVLLTTPHAQPITLDAAGRTVVYLANRSYRFDLYTAAGVLIWSVDNVSAVPAAGGNVDVSGTAGENITAGEVVYLSDGQGATVAGRWYRADADQTYTSSTAPMIGVATATIASASAGTIRVSGRVTGLTGLSAGRLYYASSTTGALSATPPTNQRFVGAADSSTTLVIGAGPGVSLPDSDGTHRLSVITSSNLTADRILTLVPGDAARTVTISGDATINQDTSTSGAPTFNWPGPCRGRLTATSGTPVTTGDVSAAANLYWTPFEGNECWVYDGSSTWVRRTFSEITISLSGCTASRPYDVFVYDNAGTLAAETLAWSSATARATSLAVQNGVDVRSGSTTRRYVGSFYCNATGGQTDDTMAKRYVWNRYNRRPRAMRVLEATNSWTYNTATLRCANTAGACVNQLDVMVGKAEDPIDVYVSVHGSNGGSNESVVVGIGEDSTTAAVSGSAIVFWTSTTAGGHWQFRPSYRGFPAEGRHFYAWLEYATNGSTMTWYGDNNTPTLLQSGIFGLWWS